MIIYVLVIVFAVSQLQVSCDEPHFHMGPLTINKEDIDQCLTELGLPKPEPHKPEPGPPSENQLCIMKCHAKNKGAIKDDGSVDAEKLKNMVIPQVLKDLADSAPGCLDKISTIVTCQDMDQIYKCFPKPNH